MRTDRNGGIFEVSRVLMNMKVKDREEGRGINFGVCTKWTAPEHLTRVQTCYMLNNSWVPCYVSDHSSCNVCAIQYERL